MSNDEYLWNRSGDPDPEVTRLEKLLSPYRTPARNRRRGPVLAWAVAGLAAAAALAIVLVRAPEPSEWRWEDRALRVGDVIEPREAMATLRAAEVGQVELEPGSRLRVAAGGRGLALDRGTMRAFIYAPPAKFVVDTPSARAIDLGCLYTLQVEPDGSGMLRVEHGWVAFESLGRESFVPAGAYCRTRKSSGPGLPVFGDSSDEFRSASDSYDSGHPVTRVLELAGPRDGLTLWHLLARVKDAQRDAVVRAFVAIIPNADAAGLLAKDPAALDAAWNLLELGDTSWWRTWKRDWQP
jgi:hypothetical protein